MTATFEQGKDAVAQLVAHFRANDERYLSPAYKETWARQNPTFVHANEPLGSRKPFHAATSDSARALLERQIDATDREIDRLVYDLYGLTDDEVKIVEEV